MGRRSYHRRMMITGSNILECLCLLFIVSIFSFSSHRVSSQEVSSMNETNNTSSNEIDLDQLEYLCQHYYPQEFIVSAEVLESGCRLECVLLKSSGDHGSNFFDASVTKVHNLNEGLSCDTELVRIQNRHFFILLYLFNSYTFSFSFNFISFSIHNSLSLRFECINNRAPPFPFTILSFYSFIPLFFHYISLTLMHTERKMFLLP